MKHTKLLFLLIAALAFASCGSDEPKYADPEAHEKTVKLNEQYGPLMVGTWHYENISDTQRYFERLTFQTDGTLSGMRKWQTRKPVTIDGKEQHTDWEDVYTKVTVPFVYFSAFLVIHSPSLCSSFLPGTQKAFTNADKELPLHHNHGVGSPDYIISVAKLSIKTGEKVYFSFHSGCSSYMSL